MLTRSFINQGLAEMDRLFGAIASAPGTSLTPAVNVFEDAESYLVEAELPGFAPGDITIDVERETLVIAGRREREVPEGATLRRSERSVGSFDRALTLPGAVDVESIAAVLRDGVLTITLPKADASKARRIPVRSTIDTASGE